MAAWVLARNVSFRERKIVDESGVVVHDPQPRPIVIVVTRWVTLLFKQLLDSSS